VVIADGAADRGAAKGDVEGASRAGDVLVGTVSW
jgi:hypothetical protein